MTTKTLDADIILDARRQRCTSTHRKSSRSAISSGCRLHYPKAFAGSPWRTSTRSSPTRSRCATVQEASLAGRGPTFYQLHLLFDKHYDEQSELVDTVAERIQLLGGVSVAMAHDVAETTLIPRPPKGREEVPVQISRLLHAHEIILKEARAMARRAAEAGDDGTNDLLVSDVIRTNELQVWFVAEHVVDVPLART